MIIDWLKYLCTIALVSATTERCMLNCASPDRLVGPTKPQHTRPHPWKIATFPTKHTGFCKMGCELFFTKWPSNETCYSECDYIYRYRVTVAYNDQAEEARLECQDGCDIALQICQAGYYCHVGEMKPCDPGTYRGDETGLAVHSCIHCPYGRWRSRNKGKSADECTKCTYGKYLNETGATAESACLRCPAGQTALQEGMRVCTCITPGSCQMELPGRTTSEPPREFYNEYTGGTDYWRETVPFMGRW